jgi:hypothetical protein
MLLVSLLPGPSLRVECDQIEAHSTRVSQSGVTVESESRSESRHAMSQSTSSRDRLRLARGAGVTGTMGSESFWAFLSTERPAADWRRFQVETQGKSEWKITDSDDSDVPVFIIMIPQGLPSLSPSLLFSPELDPPSRLGIDCYRRWSMPASV